MKKKVLFPVLFLISSVLYAQQDAQLSQYMFSGLFYNPAYAGVDGITSFSALHRTQWAGYSSTLEQGGGPTTQFVSLNTPIYKISSGAGLHIVNDRLGPLNNLELQVSYAYHLQVKNAKMSFGVRAGMYSQSIGNDYRPNQEDDPIITGVEDSQIRPDMALGTFFRAQKYYLGLSVNHVTKAEFNFGADALRNALENNLSFTGGYDYEVNTTLVVTPSVLLKTDFNEYSFDLSVIGTYKKKMWGGMSFRQSESATVLLGYKLLKDGALKIGYAFDYIIIEREAKQATSHEFMLAYEMPNLYAGGKKIVRTPRFRH